MTPDTKPQPSQAGKGSSPRNLGPKFRENYGRISWGAKPKKQTRGQQFAAEIRSQCNHLDNRERNRLFQLGRKMLAAASKRLSGGTK
jgi:hypothetical protein